MKLIIIILLNIFSKIIAFSEILNEKDFNKRFINYIQKFNKIYKNESEYKYRLNIFNDNIITILNNKMGINQFTDLTLEEFTNLYSYSNYLTKPIRKFECEFYNQEDNSILPDSIDWYSSNYVSSVKDQGNCNSGWAFSVTGAVESAWYIGYNSTNYNSSISLSTEQLVECAVGYLYKSDKCNYGDISGAFKYIGRTGLCSIDTYPYSSENGTTSYCKACYPISFITNCYDIKKNNQLLLKQVVAKQPVSTYIDINSENIQFYSGGIIKNCGKNNNSINPTHGILVVGYGEEDGEKYWLIKNSWGETWGINGYAKILRTDSTDDIGTCGIASAPSFPIIKIK